MQIEQIEQVYQEESIDLLNLNSLKIESDNAPKKSPSTNFDLLSGLADAPSETFTDFIGTGITPNINANNGQNVQNNLFDPFGTTTENNQNSNLLGGWNNSNKTNAQSQKPNDIFGGLGKLFITNTTFFFYFHLFFTHTGNLNFTNQWSSTTLPTGNSPAKAPPTTPQHIPPTTTPSTTPQHQAKSPEARPDYSRSHFDFSKKNEPKEKVKSTDVFGDLLGSQGYQFTTKKDNSPRTINDMRKVEMAKDMDPEKLKVMEWVGKLFFVLILLYGGMILFPERGKEE